MSTDPGSPDGDPQSQSALPRRARRPGRIVAQQTSLLANSALTTLLRSEPENQTDRTRFRARWMITGALVHRTNEILDDIIRGSTNVPERSQFRVGGEAWLYRHRLDSWMASRGEPLAGWMPHEIQLMDRAWARYGDFDSLRRILQMSNDNSLPLPFPFYRENDLLEFFDIRLLRYTYTIRYNRNLDSPPWFFDLIAVITSLNNEEMEIWASMFVAGYSNDHTVFDNRTIPTLVQAWNYGRLQFFWDRTEGTIIPHLHTYMMLDGRGTIRLPVRRQGTVTEVAQERPDYGPRPPESIDAGSGFTFDGCPRHAGNGLTDILNPCICPPGTIFPSPGDPDFCPRHDGGLYPNFLPPCICSQQAGHPRYECPARSISPFTSRERDSAAIMFINQLLNREITRVQGVATPQAGSGASANEPPDNLRLYFAARIRPRPRRSDTRRPDTRTPDRPGSSSLRTVAENLLPSLSTQSGRSNRQPGSSTNNASQGDSHLVYLPSAIQQATPSSQPPAIPPGPPSAPHPVGRIGPPMIPQPTNDTSRRNRPFSPGTFRRLIDNIRHLGRSGPTLLGNPATHPSAPIPSQVASSRFSSMFVARDGVAGSDSQPRFPNHTHPDRAGRPSSQNAEPEDQGDDGESDQDRERRRRDKGKYRAQDL